MTRLTGSPRTTSRQSIEHLKATGRWPEKDGETQQSHGRDSSNLPANETKSAEERGIHRADDKAGDETRRDWRQFFSSVASASYFSAKWIGGVAPWLISVSFERTFEVKATTEYSKPWRGPLQCVIDSPSKGPCQTYFSSKRLPSSRTKAPPIKLTKNHM